MARGLVGADALAYVGADACVCVGSDKGFSMGLKLTPLEQAIAEKTDRRARWEARQRASGLVRVSFRVPADLRDAVAAAVAAVLAAK